VIFKDLEIDSIKGINNFEALNQGSSGPNTAEFKVYDDKGGLISQPMEFRNRLHDHNFSERIKNNRCAISCFF
jgi:hypothetical protein